MEVEAALVTVADEGGGIGGYVGWEEVYICAEKGRREIHYTLKRRDGGKDLAVIAKEKSLRHMTYRFLIDYTASFTKPRSRCEVVDWLNSFVSASPSPVLPQRAGGSSDGNESDEVELEVMKETQHRKLGYYTREFLWLGSPSTCKKKRKHYQAFRRNGFRISVHEFVHVLAEEDKRLVAYLDDMYEDSRGNKMVVVRWFHKIDEVGIDLPHNFNDREIFFSLCLQDLSIECIDGLATVLSPQHYAKFLREAKHTQLEPYMCHQQYDDDELKAVDITRVKGYWKQDIIKYMFSVSSARHLQKARLSHDLSRKDDDIDFSGFHPRKRLRLSRDRKVELQHATVKDTMDIDDVNGQNNLGLTQNHPSVVSHKAVHLETAPQFTAVGSVVEVLSQDSGLRGCWYRATVIKKHKDKVKLRYHDIKDAENESFCLEEWVVGSRIAVCDVMGLRLHGRTTIRPSLPSRSRKVSWAFNVGTIVDAWLHDGWWEGIVIKKQIDEKLNVYLPGEKREAVFARSDLRHSQEWMDNAWRDLGDRPDVAASILSNEGRAGKIKGPLQTVVCDCEPLGGDSRKDSYRGGQDSSSDLLLQSAYKKESRSVVDLSKDDFLSQLKWKTSRKRNRISIQKLRPRTSNRTNSERTLCHGKRHEFPISSSLKVENGICKTAKLDNDNCKYISDSLLVSSVVQPLSSLVMSR